MLSDIIQSLASEPQTTVTSAVPGCSQHSLPDQACIWLVWSLLDTDHGGIGLDLNSPR